MLELIRRLGYQPHFCVWELTLACNMRCRHCGSFAGQPRRDELTDDQCLQAADQLAAMGCQQVTLSGGEPTLRSGWDRIAGRLTGHGVVVNLISNGWAWTRDHAARAREAGLSNVGFSVDGLELVHDTMRRLGAFRRAVEAIDTSVAAGLAVGAITTVSRLNAHSLGEVQGLLVSHGASVWQIQLAKPSGYMCEHREDLLAPEDLLWVVPEVARLRTERSGPLRVEVGDGLGYYGKHEAELRGSDGAESCWIGCRAGCQIVGLESNGNVKGCLSLPSERHGRSEFVEGNLREQPLRDIWERPGAFAFNRAFRLDQLSGFCAVCRYGDICRGGCYWTTFSHRERRDNPYCFYRQAVRAGRLDLLGDDRPTDEELAVARS